MFDWIKRLIYGPLDKDKVREWGLKKIEEEKDSIERAAAEMSKRDNAASCPESGSQECWDFPHSLTNPPLPISPPQLPKRVNSVIAKRIETRSQKQKSQLKSYA